MRSEATPDIYRKGYAVHRLELVLSDTKKLFDVFAYRFAIIVQRIIPF